MQISQKQKPKTKATTKKRHHYNKHTRPNATQKKNLTPNRLDERQGSNSYVNLEWSEPKTRRARVRTDDDQRREADKSTPQSCDTAPIARTQNHAETSVPTHGAPRTCAKQMDFEQF